MPPRRDRSFYQHIDRKVIAHLPYAAPGARVKQLAQATGMDVFAVERALRRLVADGKAIEEKRHVRRDTGTRIRVTPNVRHFRMATKNAGTKTQTDEMLGLPMSTPDRSGGVGLSNRVSTERRAHGRITPDDER